MIQLRLPTYLCTATSAPWIAKKRVYEEGAFDSYRSYAALNDSLFWGCAEIWDAGSCDVDRQVRGFTFRPEDTP